MTKKWMFNYRPVYIRIPVHPRAHMFLQQLHEAHITIRHLKITDVYIYFEVSRNTLPVIRKLRNRHGIRLRIRYISQQDILRLDSITFIGLLLLIAIPIFASQWMWQVEVESNMPELRVRLEKTLQQELAMQPPFRKKALPDDMKLRQILLEKHRDLAWVHIQKQGEYIKFIPQQAPELIKLPNNNQQPMHLVAAKSGVITHFDIESGVRTVSPNTTVYEGDMLVSGVITSGDSYKAIGAKGAVYADYWLECSFSIPRVVTLVGQEAKEWQILFKWAHKDAFKTQYYDEVPLPNMISPFVKIVSEQTTKTVKQQITKEKIPELVMPLLHQKILQTLPPNTLVKKQNLLHVQIDDDTVKGKVLFQINENIAKTQPVNQGE